MENVAVVVDVMEAGVKGTETAKGLLVVFEVADRASEAMEAAAVTVGSAARAWCDRSTLRAQQP